MKKTPALVYTEKHDGGRCLTMSSCDSTLHEHAERRGGGADKGESALVYTIDTY